MSRRAWFTVSSFAFTALVACLSLRAADAPRARPASEVRLHPKHEVWIDYEAKRVILDAQVCIQDSNALEVLACPPNTKEYEALLVVAAQPHIVEAAILLIVSPKDGTPDGLDFDVLLAWEAGGKTHRVPAQQWAVDTADGKPAAGAWRYVRGGPRSEGELLNTANTQGVLNLFPPLKGGHTKTPANLPPLGTKVRIEITPK